ncbi:S1C family serine protease [Candidatus Omnitrophota bacterium]
MKIMNRLLIVIICTLFIVSTPMPLCALGRDSIIQVIQSAMPSIVGIKAENAKLFKAPGGTAIKDKNTGRVVVMKGLTASTFTREGSGVIIDAAGLIATNTHTINQATRITVILHDRSEYEARSVWTVPNEDIAFIRITAKAPLSPIAFADSNAARIRDRVYTVGSSEFLDGTISGGNITGLGRKNKKSTIAPISIIQTSFNVYRGDSGGPLLDRQGKLHCCR